MAPIIAFFVFLAITITLNVAKLQENNVLPSQQAQEQVADENGTFSYKFNKQSVFNPFNIMQMFLVLGFLMAGLFAGQSLGSKTAGAAQKLITKTGKNVQGYMSRKTTQGVGWAGGGVLSGISKGVSKIPFLSKPLGVAGRYLESKGDAVKKAEVAKAAKRITQMSPDQLYDKFPTLTKNEKTAAIESKKMSPYQLSEIFPMLTNDQKTAAIKEMPLDQLNKIFSTLTKDQKAVTIERAMKAGDKMLKIPENMRDEAMALALEHRKKGDVGFEKELLKIDPTLHSEWQASIKEIAKLVNDKKNLDPVKDAVAIKKKEDEISNAKDDFNKQVSETLKDSKPTEIAKTTAAVMNNEKISEEVKDVFISRVADPKNFDNNMVMSTVGKITEPQQKVTFASALLKARMDRVANAANLSDRQKFEAIDDNLKAKLRKNPGLREMGFMQEFEAGLAGVGAAEGVKTEMEAKIEKAKAWFMSKESDTVGESQDVSNGQLEKQKEEQATVAKEEFKKTVEKVREERKAEAEDKKAFNQDVKNKGLDADSFHQTED